MKKNDDEEPDLDKDLIINGIYNIQYKLGSGGFGKIYLVKNIKDNKDYALKLLLKNKNKKDFQKEIDTLKALEKNRCPYVLKSYEAGKFITEDKIERLYFIEDYAENGDLLHYLNLKGGLGEEYGRIIFKKILEGIQSCHDCNICHFDIKVSNILLDNDFNPIIIDFGLCKPIKYSDKDEFIPYKGKRGTRCIMCPQMFEKGKTYNGIDADIFSLGVVLFHIVLGKECFEDAAHSSYKDIKDKAYEKFWKEKDSNHQLTKNFKNLFVRMVAYNPGERPKIKDILENPWFKHPQEYQNLLRRYKDSMQEISPKIKTTNQPEIQAHKDEKTVIKYNTRGFSSYSKIEYFANLKPKKVKEKRMYKYCIKIKGYFNENDFMNSLVNEINELDEINWNIQTCKDDLKFDLTINLGNFDEEEEEENNEGEEGENNIKDCIMKVKLLISGEGEYLLVFEKKQGDLEVFYKAFLKIKEIVLTKSLFN